MKHLLPLSLLIVLLGAGCVAGGNPSENPQAPQETTGPLLDLSNTNLTAIPSSVFAQPNLERLDLSYNALTGAPQAEIRQLAKLRILNLSHNKLTGLPAELGQLKNLEELDVSDNTLTGLPLELGNLTQLRILDVSGNAYSKQDLDQIAAKLTKTEIRR